MPSTHRKYHSQAAKRTIARIEKGRHVTPGYKICCDTQGRPGLYRPDTIGSCVYTSEPRAQADNFSRVVAMGRERDDSALHPHTIIKMLDLGHQFSVQYYISPSINLNTVTEEPGRGFCWRINIAQKSAWKFLHSLA